VGIVNTEFHSQQTQQLIMTLVKNLTNFPFAAIIGQDEMKLALQLNVIDPKIGGVMIMGDRGTGKSTTIRALADLLPDIQIIKNDPFNTDPKGLPNQYETENIKIPMVELPLGATEDRVCGTINLKEILSGGNSTFEPGLLARANRGILYVDEINLLDYQNINTQYTNKKDIKYNNKDNNIKAINFDRINNTFYDSISNNNSNYSFI
jgi:Mg-chelatase subunit ChlI